MIGDKYDWSIEGAEVKIEASTNPDSHYKIDWALFTIAEMIATIMAVVGE